MRKRITIALFALVLLAAGGFTATIVNDNERFQLEKLVDGTKLWELDLGAVAMTFVGFALVGLVMAFLFAVAFLGFGRR